MKVEGCRNPLASEPNTISEYKIPIDKQWEFNQDYLKLGRMLGEGAFGMVVRGEADGILRKGKRTTVAVKMLKGSDLNGGICQIFLGETSGIPL